MTKVKFYIEGPVYPGGKNLFAYFPDDPYYDPECKGVDHRMRSCYAHVGQHSACHPDYLKGKRLAHPIEYSDLLAELKAIGYDDLEIIDSRKPLTKILEIVSCKYGAPLGRQGVGTPPKGKKIYNSFVRLYDGCYDMGGAYWGGPSNLYVKYTKDLSYIEFYRV